MNETAAHNLIVETLNQGVVSRDFWLNVGAVDYLDPDFNRAELTTVVENKLNTLDPDLLAKTGEAVSLLVALPALRVHLKVLPRTPELRGGAELAFPIFVDMRPSSSRDVLAPPA